MTATIAAMTVASGPVELAVDLDRSSPVPLYHQLALALEHAINDGALRPGDRLENELAMTTRLGLARPTARQAIQELVKQGPARTQARRGDAGGHPADPSRA